jgi:methylmalonyl-CoA mutase cobalamin-binding domain/chain
MEPSLVPNLVRAILEAKRAEANQLIDAWASQHSYEQAIAELLIPALDQIGQQWVATGETSLAQGYVAGKVAEDVLTKTLANRQRLAQSPPVRGTVVIGNIEDDFHPLGRKMVAAFLRLEGWQVHDLGVDVAPATFVEQALITHARVIGVSAMMYSAARNIHKLRQEIDQRGLTGKLQLAVGGAVFKLRPELMAEVGGDGTTSSALDAPALFQTLWDRSVACDPAPAPPETK